MSDLALMWAAVRANEPLSAHSMEPAAPGATLDRLQLEGAIDLCHCRLRNLVNEFQGNASGRLLM
jgi:hypothetical protein